MARWMCLLAKCSCLCTNMSMCNTAMTLSKPSFNYRGSVDIASSCPAMVTRIRHDHSVYFTKCTHQRDCVARYACLAVAKFCATLLGTISLSTDVPLQASRFFGSPRSMAIVQFSLSKPPVCSHCKLHRPATARQNVSA